jgi:hypothetical protein
MSTKRHSLLVVLGLGALLLASGAAPAHAHRPLAASAEMSAGLFAPVGEAPPDAVAAAADPGPASDVTRSAPTLVAASASAPPVIALVVLAVLLAAVAVSPRRALVVALVLVLAVLTFEAGVHSVHHLGDAQPACTIAAVSAHVSGISVDSPDASARASDPSDPLALPPPAPVRATTLAPHESRGPPSSSFFLV